MAASNVEAKVGVEEDDEFFFWRLKADFGRLLDMLKKRDARIARLEDRLAGWKRVQAFIVTNVAWAQESRLGGLGDMTWQVALNALVDCKADHPLEPYWRTIRDENEVLRARVGHMEREAKDLNDRLKIISAMAEP